MDQDDGGVQMVRIEQPERVYNREAVLGRDTESVFPSLAQANADKVVSATQSVLGSMNFVTETELEEIKAKRGGQLRPEDGTMEVEKSLWAVLQEVRWCDGLYSALSGRFYLSFCLHRGERSRGEGGNVNSQVALHLQPRDDVVHSSHSGPQLVLFFFSFKF